MSSKSRRSSDADLVRQEDAARSFDDWRRLDAVSLRLKCNFYNVTATGRKDTLATRLLEYFQLEQETPPPASGDDDSVSGHSQRDDIVDIRVNADDDLSFGEDEASDDGEILSPSNNTHVNENVEIIPDNSGENVAQSPQHHEEIDATNTDNNIVAPIKDGPLAATDNLPALNVNKDGGNRRENSVTSARSRVSSNKNNVTPRSRSRSKKHSPKPTKSRASTKTTSVLSPPRNSSSADKKLDLIYHQSRATNSELRNIKDKQSSLEKYVEQEIKALQRQVNTTNKRAPASTPRDNPRKRPRSNDVAQSLSPPPPPPSTQLPSNYAPFPDSSNVIHGLHNASNNNSNNTGTSPATAIPMPSVVNVPWAPIQNPFLPPSIKETLLKKIEEQQFVDFSDLLPENQATDVTNPSERPIIMIDKESGLLQQKDMSSKKVKVDSFHRWVTCWTIFSQAHLHYHPDDFFNLHTYFAQMVNFFGQYRLEACLKYDTEFRLLMASQRKLAPERRSVSWTEVSEYNRIRCISGREMTLCSYCKAYGHMEVNCRLKHQQEAKGGITQQIAAAITNAQQQNRNSSYQPNRSSNTAYSGTYQNSQTISSNHFRGQPQRSYQANHQQHQHRSHQTYPQQQQQQLQQQQRHSTFSQQQHQQPPGRTRLPPSSKACRYFNSNLACNRSPCQFLHACSNCGRTDHNFTTCTTTSSTNFIPPS